MELVLALLYQGCMNTGIYNSASALSALQRWQEATSVNISAGTVPGYKGNMMSFEAIHAGAMGISSTGRAVEVDATVPIIQSGYNLGAGQIHHTGSPTHVAINGDGFFRIQGRGFEYFTRDGEFRINGESELVNKQGDLVLGETGPIKVSPQLGEILITAEGRLYQGNVQTAKLQVVQLPDANELTRVSGGFRLQPESQALPRPIENPSVAQGHLEASNVNPLKEMVNLISISRAFELNHKMIQSLDDIRGKTIEVMGAVN
jgi:flagellar basal-body rod protein FlgF